MNKRRWHNPGQKNRARGQLPGKIGSVTHVKATALSSQPIVGDRRPISVCVTLKNRGENFKHFLDGVRSWFTRDAEASIENQLVVVDFGSDDVDVDREIATRFDPTQSVTLQAPMPFNRGRGLAMAATAARNQILVFLDADVVVPANFGSLVRAYTLPQQAMFPICFAQRLGAPLVIDDAGKNGHWWHDGYGLVAITRDDYDRVGGWCENFVGWGNEDVEFYKRCVAAGLRIARGTVAGLIHRWHPTSLRDKYTRTGAAPAPAVIGVRKPRVCAVSDVRDWAFDEFAHEMATNIPKFSFSNFYVSERGVVKPTWIGFDVIFEQYHRNPDLGIPMSKALGALRSEFLNPDKPGPPTDREIEKINAYRGFQVAMKRSLDMLQARCPNVVYLTNPVDTEKFRPAVSPLQSVVVEWNGNAGHAPKHGRKIKHFHDIVIPACRTAEVPLVAAEYNTSTGPFKRLPPDAMPAFYHQANVALCASEYEAASYSVMQAMASGLALIATDVGNHREMRDSQLTHFGESGIWLVDGTVDAFVEALKRMTPELAARMGEINRAEIEARWSWTAWRERYINFLEMGLAR